MTNNVVARIERVTHRYGKTFALNELTLDIPAQLHGGDDRARRRRQVHLARPDIRGTQDSSGQGHGRFALTGVFVARTKSGDVRAAATGASQNGVMRLPAIEAALKANWWPAGSTETWREVENSLATLLYRTLCHNLDEVGAVVGRSVDVAHQSVGGDPNAVEGCRRYMVSGCNLSF